MNKDLISAACSAVAGAALVQVGIAGVLYHDTRLVICSIIFLATYLGQSVNLLFHETVRTVYVEAEDEAEPAADDG
jgi:hypothetical protein